MQDRTINNALAELRKQGGSQGKLAEVLLEMRGVQLRRYLKQEAFKRGETRKLVLDALMGGPKTCPQVTDVALIMRPDLTRKQALHRVYMGMCRLEAAGLVRRDGQAWRLAHRSFIKPPAASSPSSCG